MKCAVYARKSTAQADSVAMSTARQVAGGRAWIDERGWEFAGEYVDEGLSGFLAAGRASFQRLLRDAEAEAFDAVCFFALDRFGRNSRRTLEALHRLADAGVEVWDFAEGRKVDLDSFEGRMMETFRAEFAQKERDEARKRTYAAMRARAEKGWVTGGVCYGYRNVRVDDHVERVVDEKQAAIVREIFAKYAAGESIRSIVRYLNRRRIKSPRGGKWTPNGARNILQRPLYRGVDYFGRTRKAYGRELGAARITQDKREREKGALAQPEESWVRLDLPSLRIVDEETARRVDKRFEDQKDKRTKDSGGRPPKAPGGYLLTGGLLVCPDCGRNMESMGGRFYVCSARRRAAACDNMTKLPISEFDDAFLSTLEGEALSPAAIEEYLSMIETAPDEVEGLITERDRLRQEVKNLTDSIAEGVPAATVAPGIRERETEIERLEARIKAPRPKPRDIETMRKALTMTAEGWKETLRSEPKVARMLLRRLVGPITAPKDEPITKWVTRSKIANELAGPFFRHLAQVSSSPRGSRIS